MHSVRLFRRWPMPAWLLALGVLFVGVRSASSAEPKAVAPERRTGMGKCFALAGSLLRREAGDKGWKSLTIKEEVFSGDLLLALGPVPLELRNGMRLLMLSDMDGAGLFPGIESAVVLHDNTEVDLDFTLERGRAIVGNHKDKGEAKVKVRFRDQVWELSLAEPKTHVALEVYGRWPRGVPFTKDPKADVAPLLDLVLMVFTGQATLTTSDARYLLKAPPGQGFLHWDSVSGIEAGPQRLPKLPSWADEEDGGIKLLPLKLPPLKLPALKKKLERLERFRLLVREKSLGGALDDFIQSDDPGRRQFAVYAMGAVDDLPRLSDVLTQPRHSDAWETAVLALRHWLGRGRGQDLKLFHYLVQERKFSPAHAEIVLQLARSFGEEDLVRPACYEMLIEYLRHERLVIRGLAHWHLQRLVPAGRAIKFNPAGSAEEREKAYQEWKHLVPDGKVPASLGLKSEK